MRERIKARDLEDELSGADWHLYAAILAGAASLLDIVIAWFGLIGIFLELTAPALVLSSGMRLAPLHFLSQQVALRSIEARARAIRFYVMIGLVLFSMSALATNVEVFTEPLTPFRYEEAYYDPLTPEVCAGGQMRVTFSGYASGDAGVNVIFDTLRSTVSGGPTYNFDPTYTGTKGRTDLRGVLVKPTYTWTVPAYVQPGEYELVHQTARWNSPEVSTFSTRFTVLPPCDSEIGPEGVPTVPQGG